MTLQQSWTCRARNQLLDNLKLVKIAERKECWKLTIFGKLLFLLIVFLVIMISSKQVYPFLAITERKSEEVMILEGWMPSFLVEQVADYYLSVDYDKLVIARGLLQNVSTYESGQFIAEYTKTRLIELGVPENEIHIVYFAPKVKDRTYEAASKSKEWLIESRVDFASVDVVTLGAHARRSRLLYRRAFGSEYEVGVFSIQGQSYDSDRWWEYSAGVREVPFEFIAYLYAKFLFRPN